MVNGGEIRPGNSAGVINFTGTTGSNRFETQAGTVTYYWENVWDAATQTIAADQVNILGNTNLTLGDSVAGTRCDIDMGWPVYADSTSDGRLVASSGGVCNALVGTLRLGYHEAGAEGWAAAGSGTGMIDLSAMNSITMDANNILLASAAPKVTPGGHNDGRAYLYLPSGTVLAQNVVVANAAANSGNCDPTCEAIMRLNGTQFTVGTAMTIGPLGKVYTNVKGKSCGLDIVSGATLNLAGLHHIVFEQPQLPGETGEYWGLRWEGDHKAELLALKDAGKLTWDASAAGGTAKIYFDGNHTYVAHRATWPAEAEVRDIAVEFYPPDFATVIVEAIEMDANPADPRVVNRTISAPGDTDADPTTITFTGLTEPFDVTVTLTLTYDDASTAVGTGTLSLVLPPAGSNGDLVWTGRASTPAMERLEWLWGANWEGGAPPANPCTGTLIFTEATASSSGAVTNKPGLDYVVRNIDFTNTTNTHTTDLTGKIVGVDGRINVGFGVVGTVATFTNGTLEIGSGSRADLNVGYWPGYDKHARGTLTLTDLDLVANIRELHVGHAHMHGSTGTGTLDLTNATLVGGEFIAQHAYIGLGTGSEGYVKFSEATGLTTLTILNTLNIGTEQATSIRALARGLGEALGRPREPEIVGKFREGDIRHCVADTAAARRKEVEALLAEWEELSLAIEAAG